MLSYFICLGVLIVVLSLIIIGSIKLVEKIKNKKNPRKTLFSGILGFTFFLLSMLIFFSWIYSYDKISNAHALLFFTIIAVSTALSLLFAFIGIIKPNKTKVGKILCVLVFVLETVFISYITYATVNYFKTLS